MEGFAIRLVCKRIGRSSKSCEPESFQINDNTGNSIYQIAMSERGLMVHKHGNEIGRLVLACRPSSGRNIVTFKGESLPLADFMHKSRFSTKRGMSLMQSEYRWTVEPYSKPFARSTYRQLSIKGSSCILSTERISPSIDGAPGESSFPIYVHPSAIPCLDFMIFSLLIAEAVDPMRRV